MRVLMLNRSDAHSVIGGDTIQTIQTKAALERLGVEVQVGTIESMPPLSKFDIVHVFNWQQLEPALNRLQSQQLKELPMVLSPIFWFHVGHWFDRAVSSTWRWKLMRKGLGTARSRIAYEEWQQAKFRWGREGRKLRNLLSRIARLLPNSYMEICHLESVLGLNGSLQPHCTVVPNGVVANLYDPLPSPNKTFYEKYGLEGFALQVGRIQSAKNQLGLIEALFDTSIPIVFVGQSSPYEPDYVTRCYERGQQRGNVYFVGTMSPEELVGIYVLAAVHALPSWRETPGLASLEAAAAGCRIVSTSIGSAYEYFGDKAWYCHPRDQNSIRQAVLDALNSPASEQLRNLVLERYTWDAAAKATLAAYRLALSSN